MKKKYKQIECKICGQICNGQISGMHLKKHGINVKQYEEEYGISRDPQIIIDMKKNAWKGGGSEGAKQYYKKQALLVREEYLKNPVYCKHDKCQNIISYEERLRQKFCSIRCSSTGNNNNLKHGIYSKLNKECVKCGQPLHSGKKYCSRLCYKSNTTIKKPTKQKKYFNKPKKGNCIECHKKLYQGITYCSRKCQDNYKNKRILKEWKEGKITNKTIPRTVREYLLNKARHKCPECGWDKVHSITQRVPLQIDHIDGNRHNHHPDNLRVLCPNCHSLTTTFGALNAGNILS